jgi:dTDP-4-dehydrorhamnose 3,5-epimerase
MPWRETEIPGLFQTARPRLSDSRGSLLKVLGEGDCGSAAPFVAREIFWSTSEAGVFRGMHFQIGVRATRKVVFVTTGVVRDFVIDLRVGSPTFKRLWETELSAETGGLVIPVGCAHGFEVLQGPAAMVYGQEEHFSPESDVGINFESAGVRLLSADPVISDRDRALPLLDSYDSPFEFA